MKPNEFIKVIKGAGVENGDLVFVDVRAGVDFNYLHDVWPKDMPGVVLVQVHDITGIKHIRLGAKGTDKK